MPEAAQAEANLDELRHSMAGAVLVPGAVAYEQARRCYNALIDRRPAAIARCLGPGDVAAALDFARSSGLEVAVRGGGHNPAGHCVCDGGLVIDLSLMRRVDVDPKTRIARSQGGATWLDFDSATQAHGLVTPGGVVGTTGVAGLTFGGGIGHLTAQHGLTCDNLLAAEVVTPAGDVVRAGDDGGGGDSELLWGLRGGGGNFGVATRLEFRLHPVKRVVGGRFTYGPSGVRDALRLYRDLAVAAARELSLSGLLVMDESLQTFLFVSPCYTGDDPDSAELAALRSAPGLVDDAVRAHSFLDQQHVFSPPYGEERTYWKGHFVRELPDNLLDTLVERMAPLGGRVPGQILLESLHGAAKDPGAPDAAIGFRDAAFNVTAMGGWLDPAHDDEHIAWTRETAAAIEPFSVTGGGYVNYMQADEPAERVRAAFGDEAFARLQALKARHDPQNLLRRNQNVPPA